MHHHSQTKDDIVYGVFAYDSDSDSDQHNKNSSSRKRKKDFSSSKRYDLTKPVNFVYTSTVMPTSKNMAIDDGYSVNDDMEVDNDNNDGIGRGGIGSSSAGLGLGLGFESSSSYTLKKNIGIAVKGVVKDDGEKLQKDADRQKKRLQNMQAIAEVIARIRHDNTVGTLTLDCLLETFDDLQTRYYNEYKICNLSCVACSFALPLLIRGFQGWDLLQNPSHGLRLMSLWKNLLQKDCPFDDYSDASSPYVQLVMEVVFPAVWIYGTNIWNPRDPEPMLKFLKLWEELLPNSVLQTILDTVVMPKLSQAVETWSRDTASIHVPWLLLFKSIYPAS
ncbi:hypothetical protein AQUCO_03600003v1 [Aquilegia coerulea]|uniref:GCF C-terminal domain-containing protein n=1 Tax=Aquilegia coerulea TaxID=218851 RepID=A0A2G5CVY3_AQUCA|nr:hypothetical protein AQUCO_03600003v1 [Aquilegia coerulea]